ncbi:MAG: type II toxin-antitoxin system prevent-host-death family antitoxin [Planctomycetota bacterium]
MTRLAASSLRETLADALNRVAYKGERIVLARRGKDMAALVSIEDLALLNALEDRIDLEAAREALEEPGSVPWEAVKARLGL